MNDADALKLATLLPSLRETCPLAKPQDEGPVGKLGVCKDGTYGYLNGKPGPCHKCKGRGWVPNITLEGLLVALAERRNNRMPYVLLSGVWLGQHEPQWDCSIGSRTPSTGPTPLDAVVAAALAALATEVTP